MGQDATAPIIIKRKKVVAGGGHHGGAWKVAYADFVTAMMAFFMLMWLLNATTEQQRKGIADYFSPTIPINRISGGGADAFGGDSIFSQQTLAQNGTGTNQPTLGMQEMRSPDKTGSEEGRDNEVAALRDIEEILMGKGGESMLSEQALRHVVTRLTDEGLIIELFDLPDARLFAARTAEPMVPLTEIAAGLASVLAVVENDITVRAHLRAEPVVLRDHPVWQISTQRAEAVMDVLTNAGLTDKRFLRIAGAGDRAPVTGDPTELRNNRIELVLMRGDL